MISTTSEVRRRGGVVRANQIPFDASRLASALATFIFDTMLRIVWEMPTFEARDGRALTPPEVAPVCATLPLPSPHTAFTTAMTAVSAAGESWSWFMLSTDDVI